MFILTITYLPLCWIYLSSLVYKEWRTLILISNKKYIPSLAHSIVVFIRLVFEDQRKQSYSPWPQNRLQTIDVTLFLICVNMVQLVASQSLVVLWLLLVISATDVASVGSQKTYQPVDVGFQFSTPVNLANTLQNSVAGPLSVALVVAFTGILVAGLFLPRVSSAWNSRSSDEER